MKNFKTKQPFLVILLWLVASLCVADTLPRVKYLYDQSGNRITRQQVTDAPLQTPRNNPLISVSVSPRVTYGIVSIKLSDNCVPSDFRYDVSTLTGDVLQQGELTGQSTSVSISGESGLLIVHVYSDQYQESFKIIKL